MRHLGFGRAVIGWFVAGHANLDGNVPGVSWRTLAIRRFVLRFVAITLISAGTGQAKAGYVRFVPPNDSTGFWYTNSHDNGPIGRGVVFQMSADTTIDSVGTVPDVMGGQRSLQITDVTSLGPELRTGQTILRSVSTGSFTNPKWINFPIAPLLLQKGHDYHIEFIQTPGTLEFFYRNDNVRFSVGNFTAVDGTYVGFTYNSFMPAIEVHIQDGPAVAPEPSSVVLAGIAALSLLGYGLRKKLLAGAPKPRNSPCRLWKTL